MSTALSICPESFTAIAVAVPATLTHIYVTIGIIPQKIASVDKQYLADNRLLFNRKLQL